MSCPTGIRPKTTCRTSAIYICVVFARLSRLPFLTVFKVIIFLEILDLEMYVLNFGVFIELGVIFCIYEHFSKIFYSIFRKMSQKCEQLSYELFFVSV